MCDAIQTQTCASGNRTIGTRGSRPHLFATDRGHCDESSSGLATMLLVFHAMVPASRAGAVWTEPGNLKQVREDELTYSFLKSSLTPVARYS